MTTGQDGSYRFGDLPRGRYVVGVERFGYRSANVGVALERAEPLVLSIMLEPVAFALDPCLDL